MYVNNTTCCTCCCLFYRPNFNGFGQQCCYRPDGNLLRGEPSGGSVDMMSPKVDYNRHIADDIVLYVFCCKGGRGLTNCNEYFQWRPSGDQIRYHLPVPGKESSFTYWLSQLKQYLGLQGNYLPNFHIYAS